MSIIIKEWTSCLRMAKKRVGTISKAVCAELAGRESIARKTRQHDKLTSYQSKNAVNLSLGNGMVLDEKEA